jgi:hypothetical protein
MGTVLQAVPAPFRESLLALSPVIGHTRAASVDQGSWGGWRDDSGVAGHWIDP